MSSDGKSCILNAQYMTASLPHSLTPIRCSKLPPNLSSAFPALSYHLSCTYVFARSIIIGISMGMMGPDQISTLQALLAVMIFHQFFEGVGLGAVMSYLRLKLGTAKVVVFALVFGTTLSIGICIGLVIAAVEPTETDTHTLITSCCNAIAAGTLLYVSLVEMLAEEFSSLELDSKPRLKLAMVGVFGCGVLVMAILAIWA